MLCCFYFKSMTKNGSLLLLDIHLKLKLILREYSIIFFKKKMELFKIHNYSQTHSSNKSPIDITFILLPS